MRAEDRKFDRLPVDKPSTRPFIGSRIAPGGSGGAQKFESGGRGGPGGGSRLGVKWEVGIENELFFVLTWASENHTVICVL